MTEWIETNPLPSVGYSAGICPTTRPHSNRITELVGPENDFVRFHFDADITNTLGHAKRRPPTVSFIIPLPPICATNSNDFLGRFLHLQVQIRLPCPNDRHHRHSQSIRRKGIQQYRFDNVTAEGASSTDR
jgi:hypothetical protein